MPYILAIPVSIVVVIVNCKHLKHHAKIKCKAQAYSRALRLVKGVVQKSVSKEVRVRVPGDQQVRIVRVENRKGRGGSEETGYEFFKRLHFSVELNTRVLWVEEVESDGGG